MAALPEWTIALLLSLALLTTPAWGWYKQTNLLSSCNTVVAPSETGFVRAQGFTDGMLSDCSLLLTKMPDRHLVLSIESLQVRNLHLFHRRCDNYLQILSGGSPNGTGKAVTRQICSHERDQQEFIVKDNHVSIHLHTAGPRYVHLRLVYTNAVPASNCKQDMFHCRTTNLCVNRTLVCDKHNNCGDYSDENHELAQCQIVTYYHVNLIASLACGLIVLLTLAFAIFYCMQPREPKWYRLRKAENG